MSWPELHLPTACAFRFSQPPGAFIRPEPARPYFMPDPLLGSTLQSFVPPAQPYAVSSAAPLVAFETPSGFFSARESAIRSSGLD